MKNVLIFLAFLFSSSVSAAIIELSTDSVGVTVGDNVVVDIRIVDAVEFDFITFNFAFDNSILSYNDLEESALGFFADDVDAGLGLLYLSLDGFLDDVSYEGSFLLASLSFSAIAEGMASFNAAFSDSDSFALGFDDLGTPDIRTASVNAPSSVLLAVLMFAGLLMARRKIQQNSSLIKKEEHLCCVKVPEMLFVSDIHLKHNFIVRSSSIGIDLFEIFSPKNSLLIKNCSQPIYTFPPIMLISIMS